MDQDMWLQVSNWIMSVQPSTDVVDWTMSGSVLDPIQTVLSWVTAMQQQLSDWLSGLNVKLDETKTLIESTAKPTVSVTKKPEIIKGTWDKLWSWTWTWSN